MPTPQELEKKFWSAIKSDRTVMLGLDGTGDFLPMTAQIEGHEETIWEKTIWFFTAKDNRLVQGLAQGKGAVMAFSSKDHETFACVKGSLALSNDPAVIDRLWNPFVAAWFEGGKSDPNLALLRFIPVHAEIWENANSLMAGIKMALGVDPKQEYKDKVAEVRMN